MSECREVGDAHLSSGDQVTAKFCYASVLAVLRRPLEAPPVVEVLLKEEEEEQDCVCMLYIGPEQGSAGPTIVLAL